MTNFGDLLNPPTRLPEDPAVDRLEAGDHPESVAAAFPASSAAWASLAQNAISHGRTVEAYAYARTGYHRGLDALRRAGWKGQGPIPWSHEPNRGFLRSVYYLMKASATISEVDEAARLAQLLADSDPEATAAIAQM
jgi:uncharacterized protein DUF3151